MGNNNSTKLDKQQKDNKRHSDSTDGYSRKDKRNSSDHREHGNSTAVQSRKQCTFCKNNTGQRAPNPFIVFYLRLRSKKPNKPITEMARVAGRLWSRMSIEQRKKYIDLANAEKKKREVRTWKKKRTRSNKKMTKR